MPILFVHCVQVEGVGSNGRMYLFKKPSLEDQNETLWNMYLSMKREKESLKEKLAYEVPHISICLPINVMYLFSLKL